MRGTPQWSPVMKTGNTGALSRLPAALPASMEPGHEDREYTVYRWGPPPDAGASMEPGHEDREYPSVSCSSCSRLLSPQWSPVMKTGNTRDPRS